MSHADSTWLGDRRVYETDWAVSGLWAFKSVEARLHAARRFVRVVEDMLEAEARQRADEAGPSMRAWEEVVVEFPLLAWATTLSYCFSTAEAFLADAAQEAAGIGGREAPSQVNGRKVEAWLSVLRALGAPVRLSLELMAELQALRAVRNALTHSLRLSRADVAQQLYPDLDQDPLGEFIPSARLVRRALTAVESLVVAVDHALIAMLEREAMSGDRLTRHRRMRLPSAE